MVIETSDIMKLYYEQLEARNMITIFNRKEVCVTYDMAEQARVRNILADNKIDYKVSAKNRMSPSPIATGARARAGMVGQKTENMYEYKIYVHKSDFEHALNIIRK